jgi:hypothetical protein
MGVEGMGEDREGKGKRKGRGGRSQGRGEMEMGEEEKGRRENGSVVRTKRLKERGERGGVRGKGRRQKERRNMQRKMVSLAIGISATFRSVRLFSRLTEVGSWSSVNANT